MPPDDPAHAPVQAKEALVRAAAIKNIVLLGLVAWAFRPELRRIFLSIWQSENAIALPAAFVALFFLRREVLRESLSRGSWFGVLLLLTGVLGHAVCIWPFDYELFRVLMIPVILMGCILACAGAEFLKRSLPFILLVTFCIPLGDRAYAALAVKPETVTLNLVCSTLDTMPDTEVYLRGSDLYYSRGQSQKPIALGQSYRGMALLSTSALVGGFVLFSRIRPFWQIFIVGLAAGPIVLLCNFLRTLSWGLTTIVGQCGPTNGVPRTIAAAVSVLSAWALFAALCWVLSRLVIEDSDEDDAAEPTEAGNA